MIFVILLIPVADSPKIYRWAYVQRRLESLNQIPDISDTVSTKLHCQIFRVTKKLFVSDEYSMQCTRIMSNPVKPVNFSQAKLGTFGGYFTSTANFGFTTETFKPSKHNAVQNRCSSAHTREHNVLPFLDFMHVCQRIINLLNDTSQLPQHGVYLEWVQKSFYAPGRDFVCDRIYVLPNDSIDGGACPPTPASKCIV